ncbi:Type IV secretory pathway, VirJ component [Rhizobium mongolense subsp. loessense]|uniref:Type IV secretory pathway, VirJ component n=1 Tax=Rhizobium mongolense subsp. loessense TaxID=158890 RepID=A0A1G4SVY6_9HYPH|nr:AcvB/VirJ family lysyl-phosphatidylglycerol hydrolase [Rhizobium mongolense]SCW73293.1 Type IV secretory pathway, VirJ component [Rhizobium mongolense subsp. loessense]
MIRRYLLSALCAFAMTAPAVAAEETTQRFETGLIPSPHIFLPDGDVKGAVMLISDGAGWGDTEKAEADSLVQEGAVVIGVDFPSYMDALRKYDISENDGCIYLVSDIESLSQQVQRAAGNSAYHLPIIAGIAEGGALALAIAAQTPDATIGQTLVVDPVAGIPLTQQLCTPASKKTVGDRIVYGLTEGSLPNPITAAFTSAATKDGRTHVEALKQDHPEIEIRDVGDDAETALSDTLDDLIAASGSADNPLGLPLAVLEAKPSIDTMAIIYSGDGGWRDIDKEVGAALQKEGIPVIGVDSLHYFWSERQPQETADDLAKIIEFYRKQWKVKHVLLIGYSFGADIVPATYNRLKAADKAAIAQVSLLSLSHEVDYVISVMGWLGQKTEGAAGDPVDDLKAIDPKLVQCIYGKDDDDEVACPALKDSAADVVELPGDHHFDENYDLLTKTIVDRLKAQLAD